MLNLQTFKHKDAHMHTLYTYRPVRCAVPPPPTSRLLHDRELSLYDGTRLLRADRYQTLKEQLELTDQELQDRYTHTHAHAHTEVRGSYYYTHIITQIKGGLNPNTMFTLVCTG